ncbi:helix-hairpin-helix domain-containing protein [Microbacterium sp. YY-01]|uniref:ComEA family DNA-binding protein n=1 Tax=Microbacterium sp. YY-01 TaxID=3421634 RepID=UPI003D17A034
MSLGAAIIVGLVTVSIAVGIALLRSPGVQTVLDDDGGATPGEHVEPLHPDATAGSDNAVIASAESDIFVHVLGAVHAPGLYRLSEGTRVADALLAAGGTTAHAELRSVNLARAVVDGEQIVVAEVGENDGDIGVHSGTTGTASSGLINLNTADAATLEQLPRIGPALAQRIIEWRESNGGFRSVDDLMAVSGIGEKLLAGVRDKVTV